MKLVKTYFLDIKAVQMNILAFICYRVSIQKQLLNQMQNNRFIVKHGMDEYRYKFQLQL